MRTPNGLLISSRSTRLRRLIASGYFPAELPPPFSTQQYAQHAAALVEEWDRAELRRFITRPELLSVPRARRVRRQVSIVNPVNQLHLVDLIAENWTSIRGRLERSEISEFHPLIQLEPDRRAIAGINFGRVQRRKIAILARYGRYVQTDIVRFFPSLPTHINAASNPKRASAKKLLQIVPGYSAKASPYDKLLSITDFISGMTDSYLVETYRQVRGGKMP